MFENLALFTDNRYIVAIEINDHILIEKASGCLEFTFGSLLKNAVSELRKIPDAFPKTLCELSEDQQAFLLRKGVLGTATVRFSNQFHTAHIESANISDRFVLAAKLLRILKNLTYDGSAVLTQTEVEKTYYDLALPVQTKGIIPPGISRGCESDLERY